MASYTRRQLALMLLFVVLAGAGLGIGRWRQTHAELVDAFETFDQTPSETRSSADTVSRPRGTSRTPSSRSQPATELRTSASTEPVDVNRASAADLRRLPGIGPVLATRIVEARDSGGPFTSVEDLRRVSGIGKSKLERLRSLVVISQ